MFSRKIAKHLKLINIIKKQKKSTASNEKRKFIREIIKARYNIKRQRRKRKAESNIYENKLAFRTFRNDTVSGIFGR